MIGLCLLLLLWMGLFLGGFAIGFVWRWHPLPLSFLCGALGLGPVVALRDWSGFLPTALIPDWDAMQSYLFYFALDSCLWVTPAPAGSVVGLFLRRSWPRAFGR